MMIKKSVIAMAAAAGLFVAASAHADHNSVWGAGFANMPNDIHNSAIEDDQDVFLDLVRYGDGADSVNRYDDSADDTTTMGSSARTLDSTSRLGSGGAAMGARTATMSRVGSRR
jgi:hypothetical protein